MMKINITTLVLLLFISILFFSCGGVTTSIKSNETTVAKTNYELVIADSVSAFLFSSEEIKNFRPKRKPKFVVGRFDDSSGMNINTRLLEKNIERNLLNSGRITFITSKEKREVSRTNRKNYSDFINSKELKRYLRPLRVDFFVSGLTTGKKDSLSNSKAKEMEVEVSFFDAQKMKLITKKNFEIKL